MSEPRLPPPKSIRLTATGVEVVRETTPAPVLPPIDPGQILAENQRIEARHAKPVSLCRRRSRRARDYWITLVVGDGLIAGLVAMLPPNPVVLIYGLAGLVIFSAGITWVMWVVMGDY